MQIISHFKTLTEGEEKQLLIGNVLEELKGKEAQVAGDQVCSRHLEVLLAAATASQLLQLLGSISDATAVQEISSR